MLSLISIHVPKTAGTNFIEILKLIYPPDRIHMDYGTERDLVAARTCAPEIAADPAAFARRIDVIHGHFHHPKYAGVFPGVPVLATLRHPVARVVSHYRHVALHGEMSVERHRLIMTGQMDLVAFSRFHFVGNAQSAYLEGLDIDDLDYAIIQEHFPETVARFCRGVGADPAHPDIVALTARSINSRESEEWATDAVPMDPAQFPEVEKNCALDMALYHRALDQFVGRDAA